MHLSPSSFYPVADDMEIQVHHSKEDLLALVPAWLELLQQRQSYTFFHHPAWFLALRDTVCGENLCCVSVCQGETLQAVLPLYRGPSYLRTIGGPEHDHISLGDWALRSEYSADTVLAVLTRITAVLERPESTRIILRSIPASSDLIARLQVKGLWPGASAQTWSWRIAQVRETFWFDCEMPAGGCKERAQLSISARLKRNLRARREKLSTQGEVAFQQAQSTAERRQAFDDFLSLEASGWKGRGGENTAIALHPDLTEFYQALLDIDLPGWKPVVNQLLLDGQPVASQFAIACGNTSSVLKIAYDESRAIYSPGYLLLEDYLLHCCNDPAIRSLSLVTAPAWAERWHPEKTPVCTLSFYSPGVGGKTQIVLDGAVQSLRSAGSRLRSIK